MKDYLRRAGAVWAVLGIVGLFGWAIVRLLPYTIEAIQDSMTIWQWLIMAAWAIFMIISEGHHGIGRRLAPRIAERTRAVYQRGDWLEVLLAPLYVFGYFRASKKRLLISYSAVVLIILAILIVQQFSQPWRGIVDAGVVVGLGYGIFIIAWRVGKLFVSADHQLEVR